MVKSAAAPVNRDLGQVSKEMSEAIQAAAAEVAVGLNDDQFQLHILQTGSGTSTNMNANEVIATLATGKLGSLVRPNDHVNMSQSSNDVILTAIHVRAYLETASETLPCLERSRSSSTAEAETVDHVVEMGRTHLMDALPIRLSQELGGWVAQIDQSQQPGTSLSRVSPLALGGGGNRKGIIRGCTTSF